MVLRTKEDCSDQGLDWNDEHPLPEPGTAEPLSKPPSFIRRQQQRQQQQPSESVNCPRCGSVNTKFCYYNNYNKSQPRHFCKSCKRHWTKGGTLRNVPIGGGRKSKRPRNSSSSATADADAVIGALPAIAEPPRLPQAQDHMSVLPFDNENMSSVLYQAAVVGDHSNSTDTTSLHDSTAEGGGGGIGSMIAPDKTVLDKNLNTCYLPAVNDHLMMDQYPGINCCLDSDVQESSGNCDMISMSSTTSWTSLNMSSDASNNWSWSWNWNWNGNGIIDDAFANSSDLNIAWDDVYADTKP